MPQLLQNTACAKLATTATPTAEIGRTVDPGCDSSPPLTAPSHVYRVLLRVTGLQGAWFVARRSLHADKRAGWLLMLRSDFDGHELWQTIHDTREVLQGIRDEHVPAEQPLMERIVFYLDYVDSFRDMATTSSMLFTRGMLDEVDVALTLVLNQARRRLQSGAQYLSYLESAATDAEDILMVMGPWPRPYGKGGQVTQIETLYENLLESQRQSVQSLRGEHEALNRQLSQYAQAANEQSQSVRAEVENLRAEAQNIADTIEAQKERVDNVVLKGTEAISELGRRNEEAYESWRNERTAAFKADFEPLAESIRESQAAAEAALATLRSDQQKYARLLSATAGGELSSHFHAEAKSARTGGYAAYVIGILLLLASAVPLVLLLVPSDAVSADPSWTALTARLGIGVLGASAATVLIRLGARFFSNAQASKRMGLELQTFDPFLANVSEPGMVDTARLELVDRAFGKSYVTAETSKEEDVIAVSTMSQILGAITKIVGR